MAKKKRKEKKQHPQTIKLVLLSSRVLVNLFFFHSPSWRHRSGENHNERRKTAGTETAVEFIEGFMREP